MEISLSSRKQMSGWSEYFTLLGFDLCVPIWPLIGIPSDFFEQPHHILETSAFYFSRGGELLMERDLCDEEARRQIEARRMIDLGHLYSCFGRIVAFYGEESANRLYKFGGYLIVYEISGYWDLWYSLFSQWRTGCPSNFTLRSSTQRQVSDIIEYRFEHEERNRKKLDDAFEDMCGAYGSNLESERDRLNLLLPFDIRNKHLTNGEGFATVREELEWVFGFDILVRQNCSYGIWQDLNTVLDKTTAQEFFEFAMEEITRNDSSGAVLRRWRELYLTI